MVRAWIMHESPVDQRLEHMTDPPQFVSLPELFKSTGVEFFTIDHINPDSDASLTELKETRCLTYEDEITVSKEALENYEEKLEDFYTEHLHAKEEFRLIVGGGGYFDVRNADETWIRIELIPGDLIVIPSGMYHRFTLDTKNYIKARRYFIGPGEWQPYHRPADDLECRKEYVERLERGFQYV